MALPEKLDPVHLARLGSLPIKARVIVEGALSGMHRASVHGSSVEFAEHKEYSPGDEIRHIMVRTDSSAQFGEEVARWRVVGDSLWITLGDGVWQVYAMRLAGDKLTISGGDLEKAVTLRRVGPPAPRPDSLSIPEAPPVTARAW